MTPSRSVKPRRKQDTRHANRQEVLRQLWMHGPASRADLARTVGVTPATISAIVKELIETGLIKESGQVSGSIGKPATLLTVVPEAINVLCIDISNHGTVTGAILDWTGSVVYRERIIRGGLRGEELLSLMVDLTEQLSDKSEREILGLGVGVPGVVRDDRLVVSAAHLGWEDVDLVEVLEPHTDLPIIVANDAGACAFGELIFGEVDYDDLILVKVDAGVGLGLVMYRQLHQGVKNSAGEIGHTIVDPNGVACPCGRSGCLETVVTRPLNALAAEGLEIPQAEEGISQAGAELGRSLAMILSAISVQDVVITGSDFALSETFRSAVSDQIRRLTLSGTSASNEIRTSNLGRDAALFGVTGLVISQQLGIT